MEAKILLAEDNILLHSSGFSSYCWLKIIYCWLGRARGEAARITESVNQQCIMDDDMAPFRASTLHKYLLSGLRRKI